MTVSDVKVDSTSLEGFSRTTFDLSVLVERRTEILGNLHLEAGSYSDIELELDYATDAAENAPGYYLESTDGENVRTKSWYMLMNKAPMTQKRRPRSGARAT